MQSEVAAATALAALLGLPPVLAAEPVQPPSEPRTVVEQPAARSAAVHRRGDTAKQSPRVVVVTPAAAPSSPGPSVPIISLSVKDADLVEVVRSFARIAGINVIFDPGVSGKVTAELVEVRWDHALAVILKTQGLGMELDGRILTVARPARLTGVG